MEELKNPHLIRQLDIIPEEILESPITIIGAGAIGSYTTLGLAKTGFNNITVIDFDKVSVENMNNQLYGPGFINQLKVNSLFTIINELTVYEINTKSQRYEGGKFPGIVISALDSMAGRKLIWREHEGNTATKWIIDPRMGAEIAVLYTMNPNNEADQLEYPRTLFSDDEAVQIPCTAKATAYTALMISGYVVATVKQLLTGQKYSRSAVWSIKDNDLLAFNKEQ